MAFVYGHEIGHSLQEAAPDEYQRFLDAVAPEIEDVAEVIREQYRQRGVERTRQEALREAANNYIGSLVNNTDTLRRFIDRHMEQKSMLGKLRDAVRWLWNKLRGVKSENVRKLQTASDLLDAALDAGAKAVREGTSETVRRTPSAATKDGGAEYSFKGYDGETGRGIYESNFPKGTPKSAKAARILSLIQDVWSKKPIDLIVKNSDGTTRTIQAHFDPTYSENERVRTDAAKLMMGNRHGSASEQRVTLDLADDYYQIASDSSHNYSKEETGKTSATHQGVRQWHYFINDIMFQEYGQKETSPYRVTVNVKEKDDGSFVYSFNAERHKEGGSTRQTLHADVTPAENNGGNAPSMDSIAQSGPESKENFSLKGTKIRRGFGGNRQNPPSVN
ncbi:MAG: hypothetical protein IJT94_07940 [Oscillibacter sp.]|nr:hypothetical protein [Oscillibacter sp.]